MQVTQALSLGQKDPLEKGIGTHSSIFAEKFHRQWSLVGYSPWGHKESGTTIWAQSTELIYIDSIDQFGPENFL